MIDSFSESILKVCKTLNKHSVEYLIIGGTAVALHGYYRLSRTASGQIAEKHDLDFWYSPTYKNYFSLLNALEELGQDVKEFREETTPNPKRSFFKLESDQFTIDFLPEVPGLPKFLYSSQQKVISMIDGVEIPVISFNDLLLSKQTQGRPKDIEDIEELKKRFPPK